QYACGFLKTVPLFLQGKLGLYGTIAAYALDQARPSESTGNKLIDLALGGTKGGLMRGAFSILGSRELSIVGKGVALGASSRLIDVALTRQTYVDLSTGKFSLDTGLCNVSS